MLYGHGDNPYQYNKKLKANFSSNVYFKGPSVKLLEHLQKHVGNIANYPEVMAESLTGQIAQTRQLTPENIFPIRTHR